GGAHSGRGKRARGRALYFGKCRRQLDDEGGVCGVAGDHRRARADDADPVLRCVMGGACERGDVQNYEEAAQGAAGGSAHGEIQNVFQSGEGDPRARTAANAAEAGAGGCGGMVSGEWVCEGVSRSSQATMDAGLISFTTG